MSRAERNWKVDDQLEFCDVCGRRIMAQSRILGTAQGLAGRWVCDWHAELSQNPSYMDYGGAGNQMPDRQPDAPHSGVNWIQDETDSHS